MYGNGIIGPLFLEENLTVQLYLNFLENAMYPSIVQSMDKQVDKNGAMELTGYNLQLQQDGALFIML